MTLGRNVNVVKTICGEIKMKMKKLIDKNYEVLK